jgi:hypothetical protein
MAPLTTDILHRQLSRIGIAVLGLILGVATGCAHDGAADKPAMNAGEGGIAGKLVDAEQRPFDLMQAGEGGAKELRIELVSPTGGAVDATHPRKSTPDFVFNHVTPGTYELSVYRMVQGKRSIAGSKPVTVDPGQITSVTLQLQVTPVP